MVPHSRILQTELHGCLSKDNKHKLLKVLRLTEGSEFYITDGKGNEAKAILEDNANYSAKEWYQPNREPRRKITLYVALIKGNRFEWIIEKATEMGVNAIVPLISKRCIQKPPSLSKLERWQKIALNAMMQCGGCMLPMIGKPISLSDLPSADTRTFAYLLHEKNLNSISLSSIDIKNEKEILLATGPEGGFSNDEVSFLLTEKKWQSVWLGRRLFRADTAPIIALSNLLSSSWL